MWCSEFPVTRPFLVYIQFVYLHQCLPAFFTVMTACGITLYFVLADVSGLNTYKHTFFLFNPEGLIVPQ